MDKHERAERFTLYVGLELKGRIVSQGFTAAQVADAMGRSRAAFSRWLNGKQSIPLSVVCEASEVIGVDPSDVVAKAYDRLAFLHGEASDNGQDGGRVVHGRFGQMGSGQDFSERAVAHHNEVSIFEEQDQSGEIP